LDCSDEISLDKFKKGIRETAELFPIKNIAFTGGEPTLHPHFLDIASYAKNYSENVSVTTNGFYCTTRDRIKELLSAGVNRFSFSYHGVGVQDEFTRVKGCEARLRQAIDWLMEEKETNSKLYIKIGSLFNGYNIGGVEEVLNYAESKGIDLYIEVLDSGMPIFASSSLAETRKQAVEQEVLDSAILKIKEWKQNGRRILIDEKGIEFINRWFSCIPLSTECPLWNTDLYIESNGNVRTGCWSLQEVGNILKQSMAEIVEGNLYQKNVEDMIHRKCGGCTCGYLMQAKFIDL
jgi:MoaA/NifB/PqqE/SkfB family radical SAM enzyme